MTYAIKIYVSHVSTPHIDTHSLTFRIKKTWIDATFYYMKEKIDLVN